MRGVQTYIRTAELGVALFTTYMTTVTLFQTSIYAKIRPMLLRYGGPILGGFRIDIAYFDLALLVLAIVLSALFWRQGDEASFGWLFSMNMILFFPAVIDFSMFNWVDLLLSYDPSPRVTPLWVFGVGILLQATYIGLRSMIQFRGVREELMGRGAAMDDVDDVSKGQMIYLGELMVGTAAITAFIYVATSPLKSLLKFRGTGLPYSHMIIGVACTIIIAAGTLMYLRSQGRTPAQEQRGVNPHSESWEKKEVG